MLTTVTISGADDQVDPSELAALSEEFPFVEWGILLSASRAGTHRYPTYDTVCRFARYRPGRLRLSGHLCGAQAREVLEYREASFMALEFFRRVQINGYAPRSPGAVAFALANPHQEVIFQVRGSEWMLAAVWDAMRVPNASILFDPSGGTGRALEAFPAAAGVPIGYAGGIGPDNVAATLCAINDHVGKFGQPFWIDMESGVRTDDVFDLAKVRAVLEKCALAILPDDMPAALYLWGDQDEPQEGIGGQ
jgi:hypothetical protein